jgi:RNA polymerase sigma factor (sigma-70 family)
MWSLRVSGAGATGTSRRRRFRCHRHDTLPVRDVTAHDHDWLLDRFEEHRPHLRAVAFRMLGSANDADDALQEAWLRASRAGADGVENIGGWLTTVVARVCLNVLRTRESRREASLDVTGPEPLVTAADALDAEQEALLAEAVGLALYVVLDTLSPPERVAFVLHDSFGVPFDEIAAVLGRSEAATRQLASRGRRRVQAAEVEPDVRVAEQRAVVDAFYAAAREGDLDALVAVLDPDVAARSDGGRLRPGATITVRGAREVAARAASFSGLAPFLTPVLVNGVAGAFVAPHGQPFSLMAFTVRGGRVVAIDAILDPLRLRRIAESLGAAIRT